MTKKKEDPYIKYAEPHDLTLESYKRETKLDIVWTHRMKGAIIDDYEIPPRISGPKPLCCCCPCGVVIY